MRKFVKIGGFSCFHTCLYLIVTVPLSCVPLKKSCAREVAFDRSRARDVAFDRPRALTTY